MSSPRPRHRKSAMMQKLVLVVMGLRLITVTVVACASRPGRGGEVYIYRFLNG
jgi:hypothetical protein